MATFTAAYDFTGRTLIDRDGDKLGKAEELYDTGGDGGRPEWALVRSGLLGMKTTLVPLRDARPDGENVRLPIEKAQLKDAPHGDGELSAEEERRLFAHFGMPPSGDGAAEQRGSVLRRFVVEQPTEPAPGAGA